MVAGLVGPRFWGFRLRLPTVIWKLRALSLPFFVFFFFPLLNQERDVSHDS